LELTGTQLKKDERRRRKVRKVALQVWSVRQEEREDR
jgi:hypothetical protein